MLQAAAADHTGARHDEQAGSGRWQQQPVSEAEFQKAQRMVSCVGLQDITNHAVHVAQQVVLCCIIGACVPQAGYPQWLGRQCFYCPDICTC